jgi:reactive intermediate/imine deaminase
MRIRVAFVTIILVSIVAIAMTAQTREQRHITRTNPPTLSKPTGYTHVVETVGAVKMIYISGQVAFDESGKIVGEGDMGAQAEQIFRNLDTALKAAGAGFADVVKMNTYITDVTKAPAVRDVRAKYFGDTAPASTFVEVKGLVRPELMLEIEVVAAVPENAGSPGK